jgi:hypothetical protein
MRALRREQRLHQASRCAPPAPGGTDDHAGRPPPAPGLSRAAALPHRHRPSTLPALRCRGRDPPSARRGPSRPRFLTPSGYLMSLPMRSRRLSLPGIRQGASKGKSCLRRALRRALANPAFLDEHALARRDPGIPTQGAAGDGTGSPRKQRIRRGGDTPSVLRRGRDGPSYVLADWYAVLSSPLAAVSRRRPWACRAPPGAATSSHLRRPPEACGLDCRCRCEAPP